MSLSQRIDANIAGLDGFLDEVFAAEAEFAAAEIAKEIRIMRAGGLDDDAIKAVLEADFRDKGRIFELNSQLISPVLARTATRRRDSSPLIARRSTVGLGLPLVLPTRNRTPSE